MSISTVVYNLLQVSSGGIINGAARDYWRFVYGQGTQTDKNLAFHLTIWNMNIQDDDMRHEFVNTR